MKAGRLRHRGVLQHLTTGSPQYSASGARNDEWANLDAGDGKSWMDIEPLRGRELFAAQEHHNGAEVRITIRYRDDIIAGRPLRVVHDGLYYSVLGNPVDKDLRHREMQLMTTQGLIEGHDGSIG